MGMGATSGGWEAGLGFFFFFGGQAVFINSSKIQLHISFLIMVMLISLRHLRLGSQFGQSFLRQTLKHCICVFVFFSF